MQIPYDIVSAAFAFIFATIFLFMALRGGTRMMAERAEKIAKAQPAEARIISYEQKLGGRDNLGRYSSIVFQLDVMPTDKKVSYRASSCWKVYPMAVPSVQPEKYVAVRVDVKDPQIIYPDLPSVEYDWMQAQIEASHK